jgi:hypothetical protein
VTDWRTHFPDDSRVSWDRRVADATGAVRQVALAFDPSSDAEVVLHGTVVATVDTLIP